MTEARDGLGTDIWDGIVFAAGGRFIKHLLHLYSLVSAPTDDHEQDGLKNFPIRVYKLRSAPAFVKKQHQLSGLREKTRAYGGLCFLQGGRSATFD
jgi:hypothetical protein